MKSFPSYAFTSCLPVCFHDCYVVKLGFKTQKAGIDKSFLVPYKVSDFGKERDMLDIDYGGKWGEGYEPLY